MSFNLFNDCDYAGWLYKQGSLVRTWKRRFFLLKGKLLTYYDIPPMKHEKEKGKLKIITIETNKKINNGLIIHGTEGRLLNIYADSFENCKKWYDIISLACEKNDRMSSRDSFQQISYLQSNNRNSLPTNIREFKKHSLSVITHSGWLYKEGRRVKNWKRRFFSLKGRNLSYYKSAHMGGTSKGYGYAIDVIVSNDKPFSLNITLESDNNDEDNRILRVSADSQLDIDMWQNVILTAIDESNDSFSDKRKSDISILSGQGRMSLPCRNSKNEYFIEYPEENIYEKTTCYKIEGKNKMKLKKDNEIPYSESWKDVDKKINRLSIGNKKEMTRNHTYSSSEDHCNQKIKENCKNTYNHSSKKVRNDFSNNLHEISSQEEQIDDESDGDWI